MDAAMCSFADTLSRVEAAQLRLLVSLMGRSAPGLDRSTPRLDAAAAVPMAGAVTGAGRDAMLGFLVSMLLRNRGSTRDVPPPGLSGACLHLPSSVHLLSTFQPLHTCHMVILILILCWALSLYVTWHLPASWWQATAFFLQWHLRQSLQLISMNAILRAPYQCMLHPKSDDRCASPAAADPTLLISIFFALLRLLRPSLDHTITFPTAAIFVKGAWRGDADPLGDLPRLGGVVTHLLREVPVPASQQGLLTLAGVLPVPDHTDVGGTAGRSGSGGGGDVGAGAAGVGGATAFAATAATAAAVGAAGGVAGGLSGAGEVVQGGAGSPHTTHHTETLGDSSWWEDEEDDEEAARQQEDGVAGEARRARAAALASSQQQGAVPQLPPAMFPELLNTMLMLYSWRVGMSIRTVSTLLRGLYVVCGLCTGVSG